MTCTPRTVRIRERMASTPIGSMTAPAGGAAGVETSGTAEVSAAPTSCTVFFVTTLFAFRPDAQDYTKARSGSCCITVCKLSISCLIFVSEISQNRYNAPRPLREGERPREPQREGEHPREPHSGSGRACRGRLYGEPSSWQLKERDNGVSGGRRRAARANCLDRATQ